MASGVSSLHMRPFVGFDSHISFASVVTLIQAVVWPLVVVTLIFIYRREIPKLIQAIGGRVSKFSAVGVTLELAAAAPLPESLRVRLEDIREPTSSGPPPVSGMQSLLELARSTDPVDYVRIDLREGMSWLTSRLYLFSVVLPPILGLRCFVFVCSRGEIPRYFLGLASPEAVKIDLEARYPWLRYAVLDAQLSPLGGQIPNRYASWYLNDTAKQAFRDLTGGALRVPLDPKQTEALCKLTGAQVRGFLDPDQAEAVQKLRGLAAQVSLSQEQAEAFQTLIGVSAPVMLSPEEAAALRELATVSAKVKIEPQQLEALRRIGGTSFQEASLNPEQAQALKNLFAAFTPTSLNREQAESLESLMCELTHVVDWSQTGQVENFVSAFLQSPRLKRLHKVPPGEGTEPDEDDWMQLGEVDERARWIRNERQLLDLLGDDLRRQYVVLDGNAIAPNNADDQTKAVLSKQGDFVAVIDSEGRFKRLIDRRALLERMARAGR